MPLTPSPPSSLRSNDHLIWGLGATLAAAGLAIDLLSRGLIGGALYLLAVVLGVWAGSRHYALVAGSVTALVVVLVGLAKAYWLALDAAAPERAGLVFACGLLAMALRIEKEREWRARAGVTQLANLKRALDHAAIVATTDVTGRITYANDKFCEISEYSRQELLGQDHRLINSRHHPPEFIRGLWHTIASGRVWHGEIRNRAKSGRYYWVDTTIVPFLNERGVPHEYVAIRSDITARKAAEERLVQQAALAQVGQLAAVMAHEVRNPLAGIKGTFQVLMGRRRTGDEELPVMREAVARVDALSALIDDLMTFARPRPPKLTRVDLKNLLQEAVTFLRNDPTWSQIDITFTASTVIVQVDPELMRAALSNLLINAAQALNGRGRIQTILTASGNQACIEIRDSGPGIPADLRERVLEPFFTTKTRGGGLGLPIARRTAELHGGTLSLESPPTGGTVVSISVPLAAPEKSDAAATL